MKPFRLPAAVNLKVEDFSSGVPLIYDTLIKNGILSQYDDKRWFVTQRPSVNIVLDASATVSDAKGRCSYYWNQVTADYFANGPDLYKTNYSTPVREATVTLTSLTSTANVATATYNSHGYVAGDTVVVAGAVETAFNGTVTVIAPVAANTFTYSAPGSGTASATGTITARRTIKDGATRLYVFELETYLLILDPADNRAWYVASGASTTLVKITSANFPSTLALGGAVLNGRAFVLDEDGVLYHSAEGNPTTWGALDTIQANYSPDKGIYLGLHNKHIVAYGANTIEYFYDNANPTASVLAKRQDVVHEVGTIAEDTFWTDGNVTFFVGISRTGGLSAYIMADFQIAPISIAEVDSFLTTAYMKENKSFHASGAIVGGRTFYLLTTYHLLNGETVPLSTLVFCAFGDVKHWGIWELMHPGIDRAPLVDWTLSTSSRVTKGMLMNGDLVTFQDDLSAQDLTLAFGPYEPGIYETGIYVESGGTGVPIELDIIFGQKDFKTSDQKRMDSARLVGLRTNASQTMTLYVSDEKNNDYVEVGEFDFSEPGQRINRLGSFRGRNLKLSGAPSERIELEALEVEVTRLRS